jgi:hypothetical protein
MTVLTPYKSENRTGGRMVNLLADNKAGFDDYDTTTGDRDSWSKIFLKLIDPAEKTTAYTFLKRHTPNANSYAVLTAGTQTDTVSTKSARIYGAGTLNAGVSSAATVLVVDCEVAGIFQAGDTVMIPSGGSYYPKNVSTAVFAGLQCTITLDSSVGTALSSGAFISSAIVTNDLKAAADTFVKTFSTSTFNESLITLNHLATIEENITITITGTNSFSVVSNRRGSLPNGSRLADYQPLNPDFALPYFVLPAAAWGGTATINETMTFKVHPAAIPVFVNQNITDDAVGSFDYVDIVCRA